MGFRRLEENLIDLVKEQQAKLAQAQTDIATLEIPAGSDTALLSGVHAEPLFRE